MNINEFINQLTQWFDFSTNMVFDHPVLSVMGAVIAYLFYEVVATLKLTGAIISAGLGVVLGFFLKVLTS